MSGDTNIKQRAPMSLIHDEIEEFLAAKKGVVRARIRVWRAKEATPVVVISQTGKRSPEAAIPHIANWVMSAILKHNPEGAVFFQISRSKALVGPRVTMLCFDHVGCEHRLLLFAPIEVEKSLFYLERIVGTPVDL